VLPLSCFAGLLLVSDSHVYPAGANNVGECRRSVQTSAGGVLWARTSLLHHISLFLFHCDLTFNLGKTC
jgi:hypothetical protein